MEFRVGAVSASWWYWLLGLASATALVVIVLVPVFTRPVEPVIQLAMLDLAGTTRGLNTNDMAVLAREWKQATTNEFSKASELKAWETNWPGSSSQPTAKIIYDRSAGELRVSIRWKGHNFEKTIPVDRDLAAAVQQAKVFVKEHTRR